MYKPTLLLLLIPMLLFNKQLRVLAGFAVGAGAAFLTSLFAFGWHIWGAFAHLLLWSNDVEHRQFSLYADLVSFFSLLGAPHIALRLSLLCGLLVAPFLVAAWFRYGQNPSLVWATTLIWTLLLNTYAPLYDTIIIIPGVIASWGAFRFAGYHRLLGGLLLLFVFAGTTGIVAARLHLQVWTLALVALGLLQLAVCLRPPDRLPFEQVPRSSMPQRKSHAIDRGLPVVASPK